MLEQRFSLCYCIQYIFVFDVIAFRTLEKVVHKCSLRQYIKKMNKIYKQVMSSSESRQEK